MNERRRQERVGSLIQKALGQLLIQEVQGITSSLLTVTRVEMTSDLKSASVYLSLYGPENKKTILDHLEKRKGFIRKSVASLVKLKYNPLLIFLLDETADYEEKIDKLIEKTRKNEG